MNSRLQLIIILFIFLLSCKRKALDVVIPKLQLSSFIEIGNPKGMEIKNINQTVINRCSPGDNYSLSFDLNDDGQDDIVCAIGWSGFLGIGYSVKQELKLLNSDMALAGNRFDDTTFVNHETVLNKDSTQFLIIKRKTYAFTQLSPSDSIVSVNYYPFKTSIMYLSDTLSRSSKFQNMNTALWEDNLFDTRKNYKSYDATYLELENKMIHVHPYPVNKETYFGFRINEKGLIRLGWVKFIIIDAGTVKIIETAIQKKKYLTYEHTIYFDVFINYPSHLV